MAEYYLDIETFTKGERPDPTTDSIITIQYQRLSEVDGRPIGELKILTEWDQGSEKAMLDAFKPVFLTTRPFDFIPVGMNIIGFDLVALLSRFNALYGSNLGLAFLRDRPHIDLKSTLVMINGGQFRGYSNLLGKTMSGAAVRGWYVAKDYGKILNYVKEEAALFTSLYGTLKKRLPTLIRQDYPISQSKVAGG